MPCKKFLEKNFVKEYSLVVKIEFLFDWDCVICANKISTFSIHLREPGVLKALEML